MTDEKRDVMWALRMTESEKRDIRLRAERAELSMSRYMILSALGEISDPSTTLERLELIESRLDRLETIAFEG